MDNQRKINVFKFPFQQPPLFPYLYKSPYTIFPMSFYYFNGTGASFNIEKPFANSVLTKNNDNDGTPDENGWVIVKNNE